MGNKLKETFSEKMYSLGGNIKFQDAEHKEKFEKALETVFRDGIPIKVDGVSSICTHITDGNAEYPFLVNANVSDVMVYPGSESKSIPIATTTGTKDINLRLTYIKDGIIFATDENSIVFLRFCFNMKTETVNFTYRMQGQYAKEVKEVIEAIRDALGIIKYFFSNVDERNKDDTSILEDVKKSFSATAVFLEKVCDLESKLSISFNPSEITDIESAVSDINELYLLLIKSKTIRANVKLTATESTSITMLPNASYPKVGSEVDLTVVGTNKYLIFGQEIIIHTAMLLSNAIIKKIIEEEDSSTTLLYGDLDSKPMFISYTGFLSEEEARREQKVIMQNKERYVEAKTVEEIIRSEYLEQQ